MVTAIIPALNEERTIADVIRAIRACSLVREVIVVNDGSTDRTAIIAAAAGARVLTQKNVGQGAAIARGVQESTTDIIMTADADLLGLTAAHVTMLINPVLNGGVDMTVGLRDRYGMLMDLFPKIDPVLVISGERVMRKEIFSSIPGDLITGYTAAMAISDYFNKHGLTVHLFKMKGVSQVIKEKKRGFFPGLLARVIMIWDHVICRITLLFRK